MVKKTQPKRGMHKAFIKAEICARYGSITELAKLLNIDCNILRSALFKPYPKAEALIAKAIEKTPAQIWPDRYSKEALANPRHWRRLANVKCNASDDHTEVNHKVGA